MRKFAFSVLILFLAMNLCACSTTPPAKPKNLCEIFREKSGWFDDAQEVYGRRGVPINIAMAFIYHESGYVEDARPPMRWFLFIPIGRGSSAYGYPQAQDPVWEEYLEDDDAAYFASRDDFYDALDFVSWYILRTNKINKVKINDVYNQYLNYHEGWGGYRKKTYKSKKSLLKKASAVASTASAYAKQLRQCDL